MNILCITHANFESPGVIQEWALNNGYNFKIETPYKGEVLSSIDNFDFLIIMGGPQNVKNLQKHPYLANEINLIKTAISKNKKILGICLGAQLISEALEIKTLSSPEKEIGVYPITLTTEGINDPLLQNMSKSFPVIHWHNDMPGIDNTSVLLASSEGCPNQIIKYKNNVYGFQCHLEMNLDSIIKMIAAAPEDLTPSKFTQTEKELLAQDYTNINRRMIDILEQFIKL
ncbi:MAG: homoserine O-succinyltransferase [Rickettsiales bacterium]|jgi:GMP synthase (glutamine-hydrolysing)|nr:homoserine O-succinyltransferase [Rickettsiales bacterium]